MILQLLNPLHIYSNLLGNYKVTNFWHPNHQNFMDHQTFFNQILFTFFFQLLKTRNISCQFIIFTCFIIGQLTEIFSLKTGFEELKKSKQNLVKKYLVVHSKTIIYRRKTNWRIEGKDEEVYNSKHGWYLGWWMTASQKLVMLMYHSWLRNIVIKRNEVYHIFFVMRKIPTHLNFFVDFFRVLFHNQ